MPQTNCEHGQLKIAHAPAIVVHAAVGGDDRLLLFRRLVYHSLPRLVDALCTKTLMIFFQTPFLLVFSPGIPANLACYSTLYRTLLLGAMKWQI